MADNIKNSSESNAWGSRDSKTRKADSNKRCSKSEYSHKRKLSLGKGAGVEKQFHKRRLKYREGTENRWDYFFPSMSVTLPWESKATGEPDLAELRVSASPLHQDMALIYYLSSSTGNFPAKILISANVCFSSACILITGGSLWSEALLQLHNFPSDCFLSGLLISFWHSSFFFCNGGYTGSVTWLR